MSIQVFLQQCEMMTGLIKPGPPSKEELIMAIHKHPTSSYLLVNMT